VNDGKEVDRDSVLKLDSVTKEKFVYETTFSTKKPGQLASPGKFNHANFVTSEQSNYSLVIPESALGY
jgi:hypothetical protein